MVDPRGTVVYYFPCVERPDEARAARLSDPERLSDRNFSLLTSDVDRIWPFCIPFWSLGDHSATAVPNLSPFFQIVNSQHPNITGHRL